MNVVTIMGRLGRDPEVRKFDNGGRVCNLNVATSEKWKDKNTGETKERTEWHNVAIFSDGLIGVAERHLRKGARVLLTGQLETRKWQDQQGNDRYSTEVVLRPFKSALEIIDWPDSGARSEENKQPADDMNDEIPF